MWNFIKTLFKPKRKQPVLTKFPISQYILTNKHLYLSAIDKVFDKVLFEDAKYMCLLFKQCGLEFPWQEILVANKLAKPGHGPDYWVSMEDICREFGGDPQYHRILLLNLFRDTLNDSR